MNLIKRLDQLPIPLPERLVGREPLLDEIRVTLSPEQAVFLYGASGVGKRTLAGALATEHIQQGGHVLWLTAYRDNLQTLAGQVARAYDESTEEVTNLLAQHTPLIVVNGIASHEIAAQFIWQMTSGRATVIVLHETAADGPWEPVLVRRLDENASRTLFARISRITDPVPELLDYLNGHPLSICLTALQIAAGASSITDFQNRLPPAALDPLQRALYVILTAFELLPKTHQGLLLAMCANFANGLSAGLLNHMLGTSAADLCQPLIERGFVTQHHAYGVLYYAIHPLIQSFAVQQLTASSTLVPARSRILDTTVEFAQAYAEQVNVIQAEINNILNAALYSLQIQQFSTADQLLTILSGIDNAQDGYQSEVAHIRQLMETAQVKSGTQPMPIPKPEDTGLLEATEIVETPESSLTPADETLPGRPREWDALEGEVVPDDAPKALTTPAQGLQIALNDAAARNDRPEMARLSMELGQFYLEHHETENALQHFEQAVRLYQEIGNLSVLLQALELLSVHSHQYQGADRALQHVRQGLNIAQQLGDDETRCRFLATMGDMHAAMGDTDGAMQAYKRAIKIGRVLDKGEHTGITLGKLAAVYMDSRRYREASAALSQAIALFEQIGRRDLQGRSLGNLGTALGNLGRWHEAGQRHAAALKIARNLGDIEEERFQLQNLAYVAEADNRAKWAIYYGRQALYLALLAHDNRAIGELTYDLGRLLMNDLPMLGQAVILLEKSAEHNPQAQTLLREARIRLLKREQSGRPILPPEPDLLAYAGESYPHHGDEQ